MQIKLTSVPIDDIDAAVAFYTDILGFMKKTDMPMGDTRFVTVVSPEDPNGPELLLEPNGHYPAMKALKEALTQDRVPFTAFYVNDVQAEYERLRKLGVHFLQEPTTTGAVTQALFDDTCGNFIQIYHVA